MALPKKGRRTIVVGGQTFYYKITRKANPPGIDTVILNINVEFPNGKVLKETLVGQEEVTPEGVEKIIRQMASK